MLYDLTWDDRAVAWSGDLQACGLCETGKILGAQGEAFCRAEYPKMVNPMALEQAMEIFNSNVVTDKF